MLRSSTDDSPLNQDTQEIETDSSEESQGEKPSAPGVEDDVNGFAEPPVISTD
ncbi:MAG: hypothetical protein QOD00_2185 [Blastocatellia bacterium]|jgi:hypothetical protein|nr:hypothetical protein [Blastocatellia bacterium]